MNQHTTEIEAAALKREHASLNLEASEWQQWWKELNEMGDPHFGEMGDRLAQFREHIATHFAHEESHEWMELSQVLPAEDAKRVAELRDEHGQLLCHLDRLILQLQQCEPGIDCWGQARDEFEKFLDRLNAHEDAEDLLLDQLS